MKLVTVLIDLFYPPKCNGCLKYSQDILCSDCLRNTQFIKPPICLRCGRPVLHEVDECNSCRSPQVHFSSARSIALHEGPFKEAVHALKFKKAASLGYYFAGLIEERLPAILRDIDLITYVPIRPAKRRKRGYNQSVLIARSLGSRIGKPVRPTLHCTRFLRDQSKLGVKDRQGNVQGAFETRANAVAGVEGAVILLVDDVYTTGATVSECARQLKSGGAREVRVVTVTRAE